MLKPLPVLFFWLWMPLHARVARGDGSGLMPRLEDHRSHSIWPSIASSLSSYCSISRLCSPSKGGSSKSAPDSEPSTRSIPKSLTRRRLIVYRPFDAFPSTSFHFSAVRAVVCRPDQSSWITAFPSSHQPPWSLRLHPECARLLQFVHPATCKLQ